MPAGSVADRRTGPGFGATSTTLPTLAALLLVLIPGTAASQTVIEGEVTAKKDDRVHVEYTLPEEAAPLTGDAVEFQVTMRGLAVAAGRGQVVEVEEGSLWVRMEEGDPPFGAVARIRATGDAEASSALAERPGDAAPPERSAQGNTAGGTAGSAEEEGSAGADRWSELVRYEAEMHCARTGPGYRDHEECRVGITLPAGLRATDVIGGALWRVHSTEPATGPKELSCGIYSKAFLAAEDGIRTLADAYRTYIEAPAEGEARRVWTERKLEGAPRCLAGRKDGPERVTYSASCTDAEDPLRSRTPSGAGRVEALFTVLCSIDTSSFDEATDGPGLLEALRSFEIGPP